MPRSCAHWQDLLERYGKWEAAHNPGDQVLRMTAPPLLRVGDRALLSPRRDRCSGARRRLAGGPSRQTRRHLRAERLKQEHAASDSRLLEPPSRGEIHIPRRAGLEPCGRSRPARRVSSGPYRLRVPEGEPHSLPHHRRETRHLARDRRHRASGRTATPWNCFARSAWAIVSTSARPNFRAANNSAWPSRARAPGDGTVSPHAVERNACVMVVTHDPARWICSFGPWLSESTNRL